MRVTRPAAGLAPNNQFAPDATRRAAGALFKEDCKYSSTDGLDY